MATYGPPRTPAWPSRVVALEYGGESIELRVEDLLSLRTAVDGVLEAFGIEDNA